MLQFVNGIQGMGKSVELVLMTRTIVLAACCALWISPAWAQGTGLYDCQDTTDCYSEVDFSFALGGLEVDSMDLPFWGGITGISVLVEWAGGGSSFPSDLSLAFCTPEGECAAISGFGLSLPGNPIGEWPPEWSTTTGGFYTSCFTLPPGTLDGSGIWSLKAQNTYQYSAAGMVFTGTIILFYDCPGTFGCADPGACNYGSELDCTYPGCTDEAACNYEASAGCEDGSCTFEQHILIPNNESTFGSPVYVWCGPLPDCSNPTIGCPIPPGYVPVDDPCLDQILDDFAVCANAWTQTCSLQLLLCMQSVLGCTNPAACNFNPEAGYDDDSCLFPGMPCDDGDPCTVDDALDLSCGCTGVFLDQDGDGLCKVEDCNDENPGLPDAWGRCDIPVAGCPNPEALNYNPESAPETACILPGECGEPLIAEEWAAGFTGWMAPEHWSFSHPGLIALNEGAMVLHGTDAGEADTVKAEIIAPGTLTLQFSFAYHSSDSGPIWDPPMVLVNGEVKPIMAYMTSTAEPGNPLVQSNEWLHNQPIMPEPDQAPDPFLLPPEHLLPMGLIQDDADAWDYPYQMPVSVTLESGDVLSIALVTVDGLYGSASLAIAAMSRERYCPGCTDESACNYGALFNMDDGSCDFSCYGCQEEAACNYDAEATIPDACDYSCYGCTTPDAYNYDPEATRDDGSCDFCSLGVPPAIVAAGTESAMYTEERNFGYTLLANDGDLIESRLYEAGFIVLDDFTDFRALAGAADHIIGLTLDSTLKGFGVNLDGVLDIPMELPPIVRIETGTRHAMALGVDGSLHGWGSNAFGQLDFQPDVPLAGIAAGNRHSLAWDSTGTIVLTKGSNSRGQLDVPEGLQVLDVAGSNHNVALLTDSTVVCWGHNEFGQCDVPAEVGKAVAVAASRHSSMALLADSTVVVWGRLKLLEDIGRAQAIHGNASRDELAVVDADGYPHMLVSSDVLQVQMRNQVLHAQGGGKCLDWCVDRDGDGLCDVADGCIGYDEECECICLHDVNFNGICDEEETRGCMEVGATNYSRFATISAPCTYAGSGCTSPIACNYDPNAGYVQMAPCEFESCGGCTDEFGCNYDPDAKWDDGSCDYSTCTGCDDVNACNFNPKVLPADSCDYCSCHVVEPSIHIESEYFVYINSKGEARLGGSVGLPFVVYLGEIIIANSKVDGRIIPGIRSGEVWGPSAILLGMDSSIMVINENADEYVSSKVLRMEAYLEELHVQEAHVALLDVDYSPPPGNDFIAVETHMGTYAAVKADGTMKVWGSLVSRYDSGIEFGEGNILGGEELTVSEWAESLTDVVDVAMGGFWDIIALHGDGSLSSYGLSDLIPDELVDVVSIEGDLAMIMGQRSDGSHFMLESSLFAGAFNPVSEPEVIPIPETYTNQGEVMVFDNTVIARSAALMADGRILLRVDYTWSEINSDDEGEDPLLSGFDVLIIPAGAFGEVVDIEVGLLTLSVLDDEGVLTTRMIPELTQEYGTPEQVLQVDSLLALPEAEVVLLEYGSSLPDRALLGPPTDCYGCEDSDGDGICDLVDLCDGVVDAVGECGGNCLLDTDGDGVCDLLNLPGCTYPDATNYDADVAFDDGTCIFMASDPCPTDIDGDGTTDTQDLLLLLGNFSLGCD